MFKEKLSLSRRFTKRRAKPNSFWSNFCWHRSSQTSSWNPVPCARSRRPFRLAGTGDRLWEAGHWAGEGSQAPTVVAAGLQAPERHSHPCRCSALWSGLSWETKRPQRIGSALVVAQAGLSTPFNSPPAPYLRVASRGVPPPPRPAPEKAEPRAFEVPRISIPEEPPGPRLSPSGEGTAGQRRGQGSSQPREVRSAGGWPSPHSGCCITPSPIYGVAQIWQLPATLPLRIYLPSGSVLGKAFNSLITTL